MRYRLRTLLIVVTIFGVWLGLRVNASRRQALAVAEIETQPSNLVIYDFQYQVHPDFRHPTTSSRAVPSSWVPQWIIDRTETDLFHDVFRVEICLVSNSEHSDSAEILAGMKRQLRALPQLRELNIEVDRKSSEACLEAVSRVRTLIFLRCQKATDAGVAHLTQLPHLKVVELGGSQLTDESLRILGTMPQLECLYLQGHRFTDEGLAHLRNLKRLRHLWIDFSTTPFTDAGLVHLESLQSLEGLGLQRTLATPEGVAHLQKEIPSLTEISVSPP